jgi:hypothetical protein
VLERALNRGKLSDPRDYLHRIEQFSTTGTWQLTELPSDRSSV